MPRISEIRHISWHGSFTCKCRLDAKVCKDKQRWNNNKCRCECKVLIEKDKRDYKFIWSPSICECECDKSCDAGE